MGDITQFRDKSRVTGVGRVVAGAADRPVRGTRLTSTFLTSNVAQRTNISR